MRHTYANPKPQPPITIDALLSAIREINLNTQPIGKAIYVRRDAWPALRKEFETRSLVRDNQPANITGRALGLNGIDIIVTDMPLPKPWMWDFELVGTS